jgi:hypothetical protein
MDYIRPSRNQNIIHLAKFSIDLYYKNLSESFFFLPSEVKYSDRHDLLITRDFCISCKVHVRNGNEDAVSNLARISCVKYLNQPLMREP